MAITKQQVQSAVEQYLPRTVHYAHSSDLGEKDQATTFKRLMQIVLAALLLDLDAVFYVVFLASQRLLVNIDVALSALETLQSMDQLKGISPEPPTYIQDLSDLQQARIDLLQLSGSVAKNTFGKTYFGNYKQSITSFLTEQIKPNVLGRNRVAIEQDIRSTMASLTTAWSSILERRQRIFEILDEYLEVDLRARAAASLVDAVRTKIDDVELLLYEGTAEEQAATAEAILLDLVAGESSLELIGNVGSPVGTAVLGPADDGSTSPTYLEITGLARTESLVRVLHGDEGKLYIPALLVSTTGVAVDDLDGDGSTPVFQDLSVNFATADAEVGKFITFVDTGRSHRITEVTSITELRLDPEILTTLSGARYVLTERVPGSYFEDLGQEFWQAYSATGQTGATSALLGTTGSFVRQDKVSGTDGTTVKVSGTAGQARPNKASGTEGQESSGVAEFQDQVDGSFLSDLVTSGDALVLTTGANAGAYSVDTVNSQTSLDVTVTFSSSSGPGDDWYIEEPDADQRFRDENVEFISDGVTAGDALTILSGNFVGTYTIDTVESQTELLVTTPAPFTTGGGAPETGIEWEILYPDDVFVSETANFLSNDVEVGDQIHIVKGAFDQTFTIQSVDSQTQVTLSTAIGQSLTGATFEVYADAVNTSRFSQADGEDFEAAGVGTGIDGQVAVITIDGQDYGIVGLAQDSPTTDLLVDQAVAIDSGPFDWEIRAGETTYTFYDGTAAPFLDVDGLGNPVFKAGDTLVLRPETADESRHTIEEVVSASELSTRTPMPQSLVDIDYAVINLVKPGMVLSCAKREAIIEEVVNQTRLRVSPSLADAVGKDLEYQVVVRGTSKTTNRLVDEGQIGSGGFDLSVVGLSIDIMTDRPRIGTVLGLADPDEDLIPEALNLDLQLPLGQRRIAYKIRSAVEYTTHKLETAEDTSGVSVDDWLSLWGQDNVLAVTDAQPGTLSVNEALFSDLDSQSFVVTRGGSKEYGRYLLYQDLATNLTLNTSTSLLRLRVAEVLVDFGENVESVLSGVDGEVVDNGGGDTVSPLFRDQVVDFQASGAMVGDRLTLSFDDATEESSFISRVVDANNLELDPGVSLKTVTSWALERSSVSYSLEEAAYLQAQLEALREVVAAYFVPVNQAIRGVLDVLMDQHMNRAAGLLLDGYFKEFVEMSASQSSYTSLARSGTQSAGRAVVSSSSVRGNVQGVDPHTGEVLGVPNTATSSAAKTLDEEVETLVALSDGSDELKSDDVVHSAVQSTFEEMRNRAIYELTGENASKVATDTDPTLPWLDVVGSKKARVLRKAENMLAALQYMIDHPDEFDEALSDE